MSATTSDQRHPDWCARDPRLCGPSEQPEPHHESHPEVFYRDNGDYGTADAGDEFTVEVRRVQLDAAPWDPPPDHDLGLEITVDNPNYEDHHAKIYLSSDRLRDHADFLFTEADRLDHWREQRQEVSR